MPVKKKANSGSKRKSSRLSKKENWLTDETAEEVFREITGEELSERIRNVDFSKIDWKTSNENRGRVIRNLDISLVTRCRNSLKMGRKLTRVVLGETESGRYVIIEGFHRCSAVLEELDPSFISAYVLEEGELSESQLGNFRSKCNSRRGLANSESDTLFMGVQQVLDDERRGVPIADAISQVSKGRDIPKGLLIDHINAEKLDEELRSRGYVGRHLGIGRSRSLKTVQSSRIKDALAEAYNASGLTVDDLCQLVAKIKSGEMSEEEQLEYIEREKLRRARAGGNSKGKPVTPEKDLKMISLRKIVDKVKKNRILDQSDTGIEKDKELFKEFVSACRFLSKAFREAANQFPKRSYRTSSTSGRSSNSRSDL